MLPPKLLSFRVSLESSDSSDSSDHGCEVVHVGANVGQEAATYQEPWSRLWILNLEVYMIHDHIIYVFNRIYVILCIWMCLGIFCSGVIVKMFNAFFC